MSRKRSAEFDAAVRIEVLRARAAIERSLLAGHLEQLSEDISPLNWLGRLAGERRSGWLMCGLSFLGRYPMILTLCSTLLMSKSSALARVGAVVVTSAQTLIEEQARKTSSRS